ncbi:hypothetical protein DPEC_G00162900 [Dallia pectoralis]|uniref:Uncharacterized protein n=1 Tax=Dallia pectoralis TaxID=75939 RepID=A0ACC2GH76_DALPE|nr:hypothetical protein DPEC_G00162900 [Dallia pectoralis]
MQAFGLTQHVCRDQSNPSSQITCRGRSYYPTGHSPTVATYSRGQVCGSGLRGNTLVGEHTPWIMTVGKSTAASPGSWPNGCRSNSSPSCFILLEAGTTTVKRLDGPVMPFGYSVSRCDIALQSVITTSSPVPLLPTVLLATSVSSQVLQVHSRPSSSFTG